MLMEPQPDMALKVTNMENSFKGPVDPLSLQTESISASNVQVSDTCTYFLEVGSLRRMEFYWSHLSQRHLRLSTNRLCRGNHFQLLNLLEDRSLVLLSIN